MTLGRITPHMRLWCKRLLLGARWWRTRDYSYRTHCDKFRTPSYAMVEEMRDLGLVVFVEGDARTGYAWEAKLTELGEQIGRMQVTSLMRRYGIPGEFDNEQLS